MNVGMEWLNQMSKEPLATGGFRYTFWDVKNNTYILESKKDLNFVKGMEWFFGRFTIKDSKKDTEGDMVYQVNSMRVLRWDKEDGSMKAIEFENISLFLEKVVREKIKPLIGTRITVKQNGKVLSRQLRYDISSSQCYVKIDSKYWVVGPTRESYTTGEWLLTRKRD